MSTNPLGVLFLWIPKTAGMSIWSALCEAYTSHSWWLADHEAFDPSAQAITLRHHGIAAAIKSGLLNRESVSSRYKIAFVRNPWDRLVSFYEYIHSRRSGQRIELASTVAATFPRFIETVCRESIDPVGPYNWRGLSQTNPQTEWMRQDIGDGPEWLPDFIGRFERLHEDWEMLCQRLILLRAPSLPRLNTTTHTDYHDYYDSRLEQLVRAKYGEEIDRFAYTF